RQLVWNARREARDHAAGDADLALGVGEFRVLGGDEEVAHHRHDETAADAPARDRGDDRFVGRDPHRGYAAPQFGEIGHIGAGREGAPAPAGQDRDALVGAVEAGERLLQLDRHRLVDRVALFRPVDGDDRDRAALLDADDAHSYILSITPAGGRGYIIGSR